MSTNKAQLSCALLVGEKVLVMGDTKGNILLFDYCSSENGENKLPYQLYKVHKNERVISLFFDETSQRLFSTSKDNFINEYEFLAAEGDESDSSSSSCKLAKNPLNLPLMHKVQQIKEEELSIIYQIH